MVEIHLMGLEGPMAIDTRNPAQLTQEFKGRPLPRRYPFDLSRAIARVVGDVERALVSFLAHNSV